MKILIYATPGSKGHHYIYFKTTVQAIQEKIPSADIVAVLPEKCKGIDCKQILIRNVNWGTKNFLEYLKLMRRFLEIIKREKPNCIHIQCGDNFYHFLGIGFKRLKRYNPIITFHHMRRSYLRDISLKRIFNRISYGVVHTNALKQMLLDMGINNVRHIEYPQFQKIDLIPSHDAKKILGLKRGIPVLVALGATREDKGLDILLEALNFVAQDFQLLIAGQEASFSEKFIDQYSVNYSDKVVKLLKFLDDDEFSLCLSAADFIVLPYRKCFDGASGPLAEGVALKKCIVGSDHGSLGSIIRDNHLGFIFEAENVKALAYTLEQALTNHFEYDSYAEKYRESLKVWNFINKYVELYKIFDFCS